MGVGGGADGGGGPCFSISTSKVDSAVSECQAQTGSRVSENVRLVTLSFEKVLLYMSMH
jgi:hypothetical protein